MNDVIRRINIDLYAPKIYEVIRAQQGDEKSRYAEFELFNQGIPYEVPNDVVANVEGTRGNRSGYIKPCEINDNVVSFELDKDLLYYDGVAKLKLVLYKDDKILSTIPFTVSIEKNPLFDIEFERDEYSLIYDILQRIKELEKKSGGIINTLKDNNDLMFIDMMKIQKFTKVEEDE